MSHPSRSCATRQIGGLERVIGKETYDAGLGTCPLMWRPGRARGARAGFAAGAKRIEKRYPVRRADAAG